MSSDPLQGAGVCSETNYTDYAPEVCVEPEYFTPVPQAQVPTTVVPPEKTGHKHPDHKHKVQEAVSPQDHYSEVNQMCLVEVSKLASNPLFSAPTCGTENLNQSFMAVPENYDLILCQLDSKEKDPELKQLQEQQGKLVFVYCVAKKKDPEILKKALATGQSKQVQHAALKALKDAKVDLKDPAMEAVVVEYIQSTNDPTTKDPEGKKLAVAALLQVDTPPKSDGSKPVNDAAVSEGTGHSAPATVVAEASYTGEPDPLGYTPSGVMLSGASAEGPEKEKPLSSVAGAKPDEVPVIVQGSKVLPPSPVVPQGVVQPVTHGNPGVMLSAVSGSAVTVPDALDPPRAVANPTELPKSAAGVAAPVTLVLSSSDPSCSQVLLRFMSGAGQSGQPTSVSTASLSPSALQLQKVLQGLKSDPIAQGRLAQEIFFLLSAREIMTPVLRVSQGGVSSVGLGTSSLAKPTVSMGIIVQLSLVPAGTSGGPDGIQVTLQGAGLAPSLAGKNEPPVLVLHATVSSEQGVAHLIHGDENAPTNSDRQSSMGGMMVFHARNKHAEDSQEVAFVPVNPALFVKLSKESGWGTLQAMTQSAARDRGASVVSEQERNLSDHQGGQGDSAGDERDQAGGGQQGADSDEPEDFDYAFADEEEELDNESAAV